ncbi:MAG: HEAT repeat domain-containing protein [Kofleriaceae bacterium]
MIARWTRSLPPSPTFARGPTPSRIETAASGRCNYRDWRAIYNAFDRALAEPVERWQHEFVETALYAIARDNENFRLVYQIPIASLAWFAGQARVYPDTDARWQFAMRLGTDPIPDGERLLLQFFDDTDEYVRRRALGSLARLGSATVTDLALHEWNTAAADFPWTRMNALHALHRVSSPAYPAKLAEALASPEPLLAEYAGKLARGEDVT